MKLLKNSIKKFISLFGWELIKKRTPPEPNPYGKIDYELLKTINDCKGILHLGAHRGTEAEVYNWFGKNVIWVEALPEIFSHLKTNLMFYKNQIPLLALLSDRDAEKIIFYISNHDGACSSMFKFTDEIKKSPIWSRRNYKMTNQIKLQSITLDTLMINNQIDPKKYDHWVMDLQGAELKALKGASNCLKYCKSIYIEVSTKQFYESSVTWSELNEWLNQNNFFSTKVPEKDEEDILFLRK